MTKKMMKIISMLLVTIAMLGIVSTPVFANATDATGATGATKFTVGEVGYDPSGAQTETSKKAGSIMDTIIGVVQVIGIAIAVIMLIFVAIKYLTSAPNDKAEIKKHAVVYVVGAIVLFGASGILGIIKQFATSL